MERGELSDTSSQLSDKSMQSGAAVDDEYETFDLHLPVSRQLIVRRVSSSVGPPQGGGGGGSVNLVRVLAPFSSFVNGLGGVISIL